MVSASPLTVVLQGALPADTAGQGALRRLIADLRLALPGAAVVLSTWRGGLAGDSFAADQTVYSPDPEALPPYKLGACKTNNVNRQIVSSAAGLFAVQTPFAMKLRNDALVANADALAALWTLVACAPEGRRIVTASHFSLNPRQFERMPFHFSDWFQLGSTTAVRALWQCPLMTHPDATHYARQPHAAHSNAFERRFIARWPAEQYLWRHHAQRLGYRVPDFHNDAPPAVLTDHDRFLARELLLVSLQQAGLQLPALAWAARSGLQRFNCLNPVDWLALAASEGQCVPTAAQARHIARRNHAQRWVNRSFRAVSPLVPWLTRPPLKNVASWALKGLDAWSRPASAETALPLPSSTFPVSAVVHANTPTPTPATHPPCPTPCSTS